MVENTGDKLFQVLKKQTDRVIYFSQVENISPNIAVHEMRKSFKRIRSLLQLYKISGNEYAVLVENQLIKFGKLLSPIRNSCVNLSVLEKIANENSHIPESKFLFVKEKLTEKNKEFIRSINDENQLAVNIRSFMLLLADKIVVLIFVASPMTLLTACNAFGLRLKSGQGFLPIFQRQLWLDAG